MKHEGDGDTSCNWGTWNSLQMLGRKTGRVDNQRTNRDYLDYGFIELIKNTQKNIGDLRRFAVSQIPVKYHQLTLL